MRYKHTYYDKFDNHFPNKPHWVQDEFTTSTESERFHCSQGYIYMREGARGMKFGVNKKCAWVSGCGIRFDGNWIGKSENS